MPPWVGIGIVGAILNAYRKADGEEEVKVGRKEASEKLICQEGVDIYQCGCVRPAGPFGKSKTKTGCVASSVD